MANGKYVPGDPSVFVRGKQAAAARGAAMTTSPDVVLEEGAEVFSAAGLGLPTYEERVMADDFYTGAGQEQGQVWADRGLPNPADRAC